MPNYCQMPRPSFAGRCRNSLNSNSTEFTNWNRHDKASSFHRQFAEISFALVVLRHPSFPSLETILQTIIRRPIRDHVWRGSKEGWAGTRPDERPHPSMVLIGARLCPSWSRNIDREACPSNPQAAHASSPRSGGQRPASVCGLSCGVVDRQASSPSHHRSWPLPARYRPAHSPPNALQGLNEPHDDPAPCDDAGQHEEIPGAHGRASRCACVRSRARSESATRPMGYLVSVNPCGTSTLTASP